MGVAEEELGAPGKGAKADPGWLSDPAMAQDGLGGQVGPAEFLERSLTRVCLLCSPHPRGDWDGRG